MPPSRFAKTGATPSPVPPPAPLPTEPKKRSRKPKNVETETPTAPPPPPQPVQSVPSTPSTPSKPPTPLPTEPYISVTVSNFRCWEDTHTWHFPMHRGLVLIHAPSGKGKTSILSAINWVISGKTALNSCTWNKKRMTAEVSWRPSHPTLTGLRSITRCNTPRMFKLTFITASGTQAVESVREGADAEAWLSEQIGIPFNMIGQLSLLSQKLMGVHSHLMQLPQADKSVFLQQLFVPDERHKDMVASLRTFCKTEVKRTELASSSVNGEIKQQQAMVNEMKEMYQAKLSEPQADQYAIEARISELGRLKQAWSVQVDLERAYDMQTDRLRHIFESTRHTDYARSMLVPFNEWLTDWYAEDSAEQIKQLLTDCAMIAEEHQHTVNFLETRRLETEEVSERQQTLKRANSRLDKVLADSIEHDVKTHTDMDARIADLDRRVSAHNRAKKMLKQHVDMHGADEVLEAQARELLRDSMKLSCPSCQSRIRYDLQVERWVVETEPGTDISGDSGLLSAQDLATQSRRVKDKQAMDGVMATRKQLTDEFVRANVADVGALTSLCAQLTAMRNGLAIAEADQRAALHKLSSPPSPQLLRARAKPQDQALTPPDQMSIEEHAGVVELYTSLVRELKTLAVAPKRSSLPWTSKQDDEHAQLLVRLSEVRGRKQLVVWEERLQETTLRAEKLVQDMESARTLDRIGREAELRALQQHLVPLNTVLQQLLDDVLFQEGGEMQCRFEVSNIGSGGAPCVSMALFQRGQACDERSLSGGEYDRLALGVSLALYRLFAVKLGLLCLDESLSSLDSEVANGILTRLHDDRTLLPGLTVMVDHHGGTGMFDFTLKL